MWKKEDHPYTFIHSFIHCLRISDQHSSDTVAMLYAGIMMLMTASPEVTQVAEASIHITPQTNDNEMIEESC